MVLIIFSSVKNNQVAVLVLRIPNNKDRDRNLSGPSLNLNKMRIHFNDYYALKRFAVNAIAFCGDNH